MVAKPDSETTDDRRRKVKRIVKKSVKMLSTKSTSRKNTFSDGVMLSAVDRPDSDIADGGQDKKDETRRKGSEESYQVP